MPEHTPGPWTLTRDDSPWQGPVFYIDGLAMEESAFLHEDDARLIVAAPDLLAALETYVRSIDTTSSGNVVMAQARAAIAKAKGEPVDLTHPS